MSEVTMRFNKTDLQEFIQIHDIQRDIGNNRSISIDHAPRIGVNIQQQTIDAKYIKVDFSIWSKDRNTLKHKLAGIFNVDSPKELIFSDEPDKYYLAMVIDDISMQEASGRRSNGSIKFIVPDGVAHSSAYKRFDSDTNATSKAGKMVFDLINNGTESAFPIIKVKHNAENGYIGLVNQNGTLEIGNREEADTEPSQKSEILLDFRGEKIINGLASAAKNQAITNDRTEYIVGTAEMINLWERPHVRLKDLRGETKLHNYATSLTWTIPNDSTGSIGSLNDYFWWRQVFWSEANNQYGFIKVTVSDETGQFLYGVETFKRSLGSECEFNFLAGDGQGGYRILKRWNFDGTTTGDINPFSVAKGWSDLKRNDGKVQVFYQGSYSTFIIPEIEGKKSAKIHITIGAYRDNPIVSHMYLDELYYRKDFVPTTNDIPNRFPIGSNVLINSEDDTVYIDDISKANEIVDGSQWLSIPPGNSKLELYFSSFIKKHPTVTIEFEERWL